MADPSDLYNEEYYRLHLGPVPYSRESSPIMNFFSTIAEHLVRSLSPRTVMDAGCAMGFLVEMLWDRGVEAWGIDISPYAISHARMDIRSYCKVSSLGEPLSGKYDLITCIEVLEHMPEAEALRAIEHLSRAGDTILFSSSPNDFAESTHVNVHQPMWWLTQFQKVGFSPDLLFDCSFVSPQAMLLRKTGKTEKPPAYEVQRLFSEVQRWRIRTVTAEERVRQLNAEAQGLQQALASSRASEAELTMFREQCQVSAGEVVKLGEQLSKLTETVGQLQKQLSSQTEQLAAREDRAIAAEEHLRQVNAEVQGLQQALASSRALEMELSVLREQYRVSAGEVVRQTEQVSNLTATVERLSKQLSSQTEQLAAYEKDVQDLAGTNEECQRMRDDVANANEAIRSLTARQEALTSQLGAVSEELSRMRGLVDRCEQRGTVFLQQVERDGGAFQDLQQSLAEHAARWDRSLSSQRAVSSSLENRCAQIAAGVQSMEPRVVDSQLRIEELTRLHLNVHQQVNGLAAQVREILNSRIWKALVHGAGLLLKFTGRGR